MERFTSRKFLAMLGAVVISIGSALSGAVSPREAILTAVGAIVAYIFAEAAADSLGGTKP